MSISAAVVSLVSAALLGGCYVAKQGAGQLRLIRDSVPIEEALKETDDGGATDLNPNPNADDTARGADADGRGATRDGDADGATRIANATDPPFDDRDLLSLVEAIRAYSETEIGLDTKRNYRTYYRTDRDAITHIVTASPPLELTPYEWRFPIVGRVPYKGFFDPADAARQAQTLRDQGYDVWVGRVPAYSTLGWFPDPVTTPMLRQGLYYLTETIIHESVHTTLYINGNGNFNEQLASFVAAIATPDFFSAHYRPPTDSHPDGATILATQQRRAALAEQFTTRMRTGYEQAQALYRDPTLTERQIRAARRQLFARISADIRALYPALTERQTTVNNARLLQFRRYRADAPALQRLWHESGHNWSAFWTAVHHKVKTIGAENMAEW